MSDTTTLSSLRDKRSAIAGRIIDLQQELDRLQADLFHVDAVLRLFGLLPEDIPTKGRIPKRSTYFGRNEITRRCYDMLREREIVCANDIAERAMLDKGLDPKADRRQRLDFVKRILVSLHDLRKAGAVEKIGHARNVKWRLILDGQPENDGAA